MQWIDEMFMGIEKDKAAESARLAARGPKVEPTARREKQESLVPGIGENDLQV